MSVTLAKQEVNLVEHTRRSKALEKYQIVLDRRVTRNESFIRYTMWLLPILVAISGILTQIVIRGLK